MQQKYFEFDLQVVDDLLTIKTEQGIFLIDTGAPFTIGNKNSVEFLGQQYPVSTTLLGGLSAISQYLIFKFDYLLGTDIMKKFVIVIDVGVNKMRFYKNCDDIYEEVGEPVASNFQAEVPCIAVKVQNQDYFYAIDTGSSINYTMQQELVKEKDIVGTYNDFHYTIGQYSTNIYNLDFQVQQKKIIQQFGVFPDNLQKMIMLYKNYFQGIVGYPFLKQFKTTINFLENFICVLPYEQQQQQLKQNN